MHFDWPTPEQMLYRVMRLRRLLAIAVAIPAAVMLTMSHMDPTLLSPERASLGAIAVAALILGHIVLFPNAASETLSLSLSVTLLVIASPWVKILAFMAPAENAQAVYVILVGFALLASGCVMVVARAALTTLLYAGPVVNLRVSSAVDVDCSPTVAHRQFALQPSTRRGRILAGQEDADGLFDVAIVAPQVADPANPDQPFVAHVAAKVLQSDAHNHQVMLVLRDGSVAVTSQTYTATADGCRVTTTEMPGDFTIGMYAMFWLTDQQADNLTEVADTILSVPARANGLAHGVSFLSVASAVLSPQQPAVTRAK